MSIPDKLRKIERFMRTMQGGPLTLTPIQKLMVDFTDTCYETERVPMAFLPMGSGSSLIGTAVALSWMDAPMLATRFVSFDRYAAQQRARFASEIGNTEEYKNEYGVYNRFFYFSDALKPDGKMRNTVFDDCFDYENCVASPSLGCEVADMIGNSWFKLSKRALVLARCYRTGDPASLLARHPKVSTIKAAVNEDFTAYTVAIRGLDLNAAARLRFDHKAAFVTKELLNYQVISFELPLSRASEWYRKQQREFPSEFEILYRCDLLR